MFRTLDQYEETGLGLPYPVILNNAAEELLDANGERVGVRIPNLEGLAAAIAVARSLEPLQLAGEEVRFIRRVLGLTQRELAAELEVEATETISRWENGAAAVGGYIEKLLRTLTLIQLRDKAPGMTLDAIVNLRIMKREPGQWPVMVAKAVVVKHGGAEAVEWDLPRAA